MSLISLGTTICLGSRAVYKRIKVSSNICSNGQGTHIVHSDIVQSVRELTALDSVLDQKVCDTLHLALHGHGIWQRNLIHKSFATNSFKPRDMRDLFKFEVILISDTEDLAVKVHDINPLEPSFDRRSE